MDSLMKRVSRTTIKLYSCNKSYEGLFCKSMSPQICSNFEEEFRRIIYDEIGDDEDLYIENLTFQHIPDKDLGDNSLLILGDIVKYDKDSDTGNTIGLGGYTYVNPQYSPILTNPLFGNPYNTITSTSGLPALSTVSKSNIVTSYDTADSSSKTNKIP